MVKLTALHTDRTLPTKEDSWKTFLIEAESTPGATGKISSIKKK
jgi:hypothetical protein